MKTLAAAAAKKAMAEKTTAKKQAPASTAMGLKQLGVKQSHKAAAERVKVAASKKQHEAAAKADAERRKNRIPKHRTKGPIVKSSGQRAPRNFVPGVTRRRGQ